jgi:putative membrane protein
MVQYNPKDWITFIFRFHKSDTFRQLIPMMIVIGIYTYLVCFLEMEHWKLSEKSHVKNISIMHGMLGFVISLLLAYRTNTAYDRWWEGRKVWGSLVNCSRNLAIKLSSIVKNDNDKDYLKKLIVTYSEVLAQHLTDKNSSNNLHNQFEINTEKYTHKPNQIAKLIFSKVHSIYKSGAISGDELKILNNDIQTFTDVCGACERIKNTPIPYSYSAFIKKFIFFYIMTLPFGYAFSLGYYSIPVVIFTFYVLASLELIAEEIEDPFGTDANDLPIHTIAKNINKHVHEIL